MALMAVDLAYGIIEIPLHALRAAEVVTSVHPAYLFAVTFLEFSSCFLEAQIAAGFSAACHGNLGSISLLLSAIPIGFMLAAILAAIFCLLYVDEIYMSPWVFWSYCLLASVCVASAFYVAGAVRSTRQSPLIRRRVWIRGSSYIASFVVTFGPRAVCSLCCRDPVVLGICMNLQYLNGAANTAVYMLWMVRAGHLHEHLAAGPTVGLIEDSMVESYFSLDICEDELSYTARREATLAVAEARDLSLRHNHPEFLLKSIDSASSGSRQASSTQ